MGTKSMVQKFSIRSTCSISAKLRAIAVLIDNRQNYKPMQGSETGFISSVETVLPIKLHSIRNPRNTVN